MSLSLGCTSDDLCDERGAQGIFIQEGPNKREREKNTHTHTRACVRVATPARCGRDKDEN